MLVVVILIHLINAVDRSKFNTCAQTPFCQRNRNTDRDGYVVNSSTFKTTNQGTVEFIISHKDSSDPLTVIISSIRGGKLRFSIREVSPKVRPRYESQNILLDDLQLEELKYVTKLTYASIIGDFEVVRVFYAPFYLEIFSRDRKIATVNGDRLLMFENEEKSPSAPESRIFRLYSFIRSFISFNWFRSQRSETDDVRITEGDTAESTEDDPNEPETEPNQESMTSVGVDFKFHGYGYVYGLPERGSPLVLGSSKNGDPYRMFNLDVFQYDIDDYSMALYGSVPLAILHGNHDTIGLFWLNTAETWVDLDYESSKSVNLHWFSETGIIDFFVLVGPTPRQLFKQYAELTGTVTLPPLFALGFHQSRWNYDDREDVEEVSANFERLGIPLDFIWLDIEHTDNRKYFVWDFSKFDDPMAMMSTLASNGRKLVVIVDPHLKMDNNYHVYAEANEKGYLVLNEDGNVFHGWCWPGTSVWPDFNNPRASAWWSSLFGFDIFTMSNKDVHLWVDMNEPSVFNYPEMTLPRKSKHFNDRFHMDLHNEYGLLMARASWEGMKARSNYTLRPFLLGRSFFAGSQRYGAYWTGDNDASWGHLRKSIPMIISMSISGIVFSGADVGGFFGNPDGELLVRWHQLGAWQPFYRAHAHIDSRRREPWLFSEQYTEGIRNAIKIRYMYLPYWYTLFANATEDGFPIMAPLWVHFPRDHNTFTMEESFMIGPSILVAPVLYPSTDSVTVYLPGNDIWYNSEDLTTRPIAGPTTINVNVDLNSVPTFYRGGSIIPRRHYLRRSASLSVNDPISLTVILDSKMEAQGDLYVDDFTTYNYSVNRQFDLRKLYYQNGVLSNIKQNKSNYKSNLWIDRIYMHGMNYRPTTAEITLSDGTVITKNLVLLDGDGSSMIRMPGIVVSDNWTIKFK